MNLRHLMGSIIFWDKNRLSHLSILRGGAGKEFRRAEVSLLTKLMPHFQQALRLHGRLSALQSERDALVNVMDRVSFGVFLVDRFGTPLLVNRAGSEIVASKDGLSIGRDGLLASRTEENRQLTRSIVGATSRPNGSSADCGGVLSISRPSGRRAYSVLVTRLSTSDATFGELRPAAAVFVTDPERSVRTDGAALRELYGFTAAEALFACKLMQGESVDEAAKELEVTINTARTHVRRLLEKTETHTHRELIRQLLLGCTQIRR
jgi:DNA-binding CsgD family transcriptional regulator